MNENGTKRREWVKTAAIVFLSIMLILTFFSNTIMNYSLPEVATQYVQAGTITAKIRGSGVVESGNPYNVEVTESRTVSAVAVKVGDDVEKDAVLMYLEDAESTELKEARTQLDTLKSDYERQIVNADTTASIVKKAENGNPTSTDSKVAQIDACNKKIDGLDATIKGYNNRIAEIDAVLSKLEESTVDTSAEQIAVNNAQAEVTKATAAATDAEKNVELAQKTLEAENSAVSIAEKKEADCQQTLISAASSYEASKVRKKELEDIPEADRTQAQKDELMILGKQEGPGSVSAAAEALTNAQKAKDEATLEVERVKASVETRVAEADRVLQIANTVFAQASDQKTKCEEQLADAQRILANKQAQKPDNSYRKSLNNEKTDLSLQVTKATAEKTEAEKALTDLLAGFTKEVDLVALLKKIQDQEKLVEELAAKSTGATITAPVAGRVTTLNIVAGEKTSPSNPVAVLQPAGKGYSMSFSVTNEQAKRLSVGDVAELVNSWRYDNLTVTLASIKPDQNDPGQKKLLTFDVGGDVATGQTLNVSVGQKSANYDLIVPNSAIREDNNGKFILIVESKPGPLNTRYIATRTDVEVLASDDTQSAISAALYGYEFVITTSTKPVEAGKQVRLAEGSM